MDIQSLRYAVTLAEELHFGRAARRHYITAQAFGRRVQRLEGELGVLLFRRTSRRVALTAAGERFVAMAQHTLARGDELAQVARQEAPAHDAVLRVGVLRFALADRWQDMRDLLAAQCPRLRLEHLDADWDSQYDAVRSGLADVAVVHDIGPVAGLVFDRVLEAARVAVVPARSP